MEKHRLPDGRTKLLAHDVRHLRSCTACGELGDGRTMIRCMVWGVGEAMHGGCAVKKLGDYVLKLPAEELDKLTLSDTGVDLMKRILQTTDSHR